MPVVKHGMTNTFEFSVWTAMRKRCYYPKHMRYHLYGGRGITVCDAWRDNFVQFYTDMGACPYEKGSIDRIDNEQGYTPENCRWLPKIEQSRNRRNVRRINGMTVGELAKKAGVCESTIRNRIKTGAYDAVQKQAPTIQKRIRNVSR